jgi:hypothetical protein
VGQAATAEEAAARQESFDSMHDEDFAHVSRQELSWGGGGGGGSSLS